MKGPDIYIPATTFCRRNPEDSRASAIDAVAVLKSLHVWSVGQRRLSSLTALIATSLSPLPCRRFSA